MRLAEFESKLLIMGFMERPITKYRKRWDRNGQSVILKHAYEFRILKFGIPSPGRIQGYIQMMKWLVRFDQSGTSGASY